MQENFHLSETEMKFFSDNGYVGPFTLHEPEEMTRIWDQVRMDILDTSTAAFPDSRLNYDRHLDLMALNQMISHPRVVDRISSILGPDVQCWRSEWFPKYPGGAPDPERRAHSPKSVGNTSSPSATSWKRVIIPKVLNIDS